MNPDPQRAERLERAAHIIRHGLDFEVSKGINWHAPRPRFFDFDHLDPSGWVITGWDVRVKEPPPTH